jgi:hypothetical protein
MPMIITRPLPLPDGSNPQQTASWVVDALAKILKALDGLYSLDFELRERRTMGAERAILYVPLVVTNAGPTRFRIAIPDTLVKNFTTALIQTDAGSGPGRYRYDGQDPLAAATAAAGLPIPNAGATIIITGAENIASMSLIAEGGAAMQVSVMLHQ